MKILHVCETMMGGVGTHVNELVPAQIASFGKENVLLLGPLEHKAQTPDVPAERVRTFLRPSRIGGLMRLSWALLRLVLTFRPDIVHLHSTFAGAVGRTLCFLLRVPTVYCPHGWAIDREHPPLVHALVVFAEKTLAMLCAQIIAVSEHEKQRGLAIGIKAGKIIVVHNGLRPEPPSFTPVAWPDTRLKILFVGRLDRQKGIDLLLKALQGLEDRVTARIIGNKVAGAETISFQGFPHVEPLGWLDLGTVNAHMAACDLVVMPSRWEGLPIVGLEAMRAKKPLLAARAGGTPELIEEGRTGFLFPVHDHNALRESLLKLDRERLPLMGEAAHALFLERFTIDKMTAGIERVYGQIPPSNAMK